VSSLLRSTRFRRERERHWRELARIVAKVEGGGVRSLSDREVARLPGLYRQTLAALSAARAISLDRNLLDFLNGLAARGFFAVYGTRYRLFESLATFFGVHFPRTVRRYLPHFLVAVACLVLGAFVGYAVTRADPERYFSFIDAARAEGRTPSSAAEELKRVLYLKSDGLLETFAAFLFSNNSKVGMLCFTLGAAAGIPVVVLLLTNGMALGAMTAIHVEKGLAADWWGWVLPHGITEFSALAMCGAAGLALGQALLFPGELSRRDALVARGKDGGTLVGGAIAMLFVAGMIEGIFRQTVMGLDHRLEFAAATTLLWLLYFAFAGRRR
jgi:uncharacterized membrane protein SpoIIM required for sporulation